MIRAFLMLVCLSVVPSLALASGPKYQTEKEKAAQAKSLIWLITGSKSKGIECKGAAAGSTNWVTVKKGRSDVDSTGLIMDSDGTYSYGTNEVREIFANRTNLVIEWGEEGNYQLLIPNYAWHLFDYEGNGKPVANTEFSSIGVVIGESEALEHMACRVIK